MQQIQQQQQVSLQQRQYAASLQAIYDIIGRTLCSFERYGHKITEQQEGREKLPRYTKKYEKHKVSYYSIVVRD